MCYNFAKLLAMNPTLLRGLGDADELDETNRGPCYQCRGF
jgi:hypothetical protein